MQRSLSQPHGDAGRGATSPSPGRGEVPLVRVEGGWCVTFVILRLFKQTVGTPWLVLFCRLRPLKLFPLTSKALTSHSLRVWGWDPPVLAGHLGRELAASGCAGLSPFAAPPPPAPSLCPHPGVRRGHRPCQLSGLGCDSKGECDVGLQPAVPRVKGFSFLLSGHADK